jgi:osmotically-inducible protein OsmY
MIMISLRTRRDVALAAVLALSLAVVFSAAKCGQNRVNRTQAQIEVDNMMSAKVRENLTAASPEVRATDIGINTLLLVVKLDGKVRSENERNKAIQIARDSEVVKDGTTHKVKQVEAKDLTVQP